MPSSSESMAKARLARGDIGGGLRLVDMGDRLDMVDESVYSPVVNVVRGGVLPEAVPKVEVGAAVLNGVEGEIGATSGGSDGERGFLKPSLVRGRSAQPHIAICSLG